MLDLENQERGESNPDIESESSADVFGAGIDVPALIGFLDEDWRSSVRELAANGFRSTGRGCPYCPTGELWYDRYELVCATCVAVINMEGEPTTRRSQPDPWDRFNMYRKQRQHRYRSGRRRCVGGFESTYDWVTREELPEGETVRSVDPNAFYR